MPKVAIYARLSPPDRRLVVEEANNTDRVGLDNQLITLTSYCERMGWDYTIYKDSASGKNTSRAAFREMLEALRLHQHDILLCSKVDRISRSTADFANFTIQLDTWGIRLIVLDQGIDTDNRNPLNRLLLNMLSIFAEFERDLTVDRIKKGMARARAKGTYIGGKRNSKLDECWELILLWREKYPALGYRSLAAKLEKERNIKVSWMTIKSRLDREKAEEL